MKLAVNAAALLSTDANRPVFGRQPPRVALGRPSRLQYARKGVFIMAGNPWTFCERILPDVSRSFALIIPQCPPPIDRALCVAYLICRLADTIEDEPALSAEQRAGLYDSLLRAVEEPLDSARVEEFIGAWPALPAGGYGELIRGSADVLRAFASLPPECHPPIRTCVKDMVAGMRKTAPVDIRNGVRFLCRDLPDLDRYCHYVAGTVGIMSTALFEMRFRPSGFCPTDAWREQGRRLGLGLQMTNIIKDCHEDAQRGVSFVPAGYVDFSGGSYRLDPAGRAELIRHTLGHLDAGLLYCRAAPAGETGVRMFLLGSLLPAVATLGVAAPGDQLQPKISRPQMSAILDLIRGHACDDAAIAAWYQARRAATLQRLN